MPFSSHASCVIHPRSYRLPILAGRTTGDVIINFYLRRQYHLFISKFWELKKTRKNWPAKYSALKSTTRMGRTTRMGMTTQVSALICSVLCWWRGNLQAKSNAKVANGDESGPYTSLQGYLGASPARRNDTFLAHRTECKLPRRHAESSFVE